jgi:hypothetical protein
MQQCALRYLFNDSLLIARRIVCDLDFIPQELMHRIWGLHGSDDLNSGFVIYDNVVWKVITSMSREPAVFFFYV